MLAVDIINDSKMRSTWAYLRDLGLPSLRNTVDRLFASEAALREVLKDDNRKDAALVQRALAVIEGKEEG